MDKCDVAVIGAGPYGLSVGAHLQAAGVNFRIFGSPMEFWRKHMPRGMHLKSEGFASWLFDPKQQFTLKDYCRENNLPYQDIGLPVALDIFSDYGAEFQKRFVPQLEQSKVIHVQRSADGFKITLDTGEEVLARRVVVAVGLTYFEHIASELAVLPKEVMTHSSRHHNLERFSGREVIVVGAGASALDLAALLHQVGASVEVVARAPRLRFHDPPHEGPRPLLDRLREPTTGIGAGWKIWMCANLPLLFRQMPKEFRIENVRRILGPAPCWFTREQIEGKVGLNLGVNIASAEMHGGRPRLNLTSGSGATKSLEADHVIAATGYRYDIRRISFLDSEILDGIRRTDESPALSANFESTVRNLYFIGITAANTFGPLLRFAFGAGFAAPRISRHLTQTTSRTLVQGGTFPATEASGARDTVAQ